MEEKIELFFINNQISHAYIPKSFAERNNIEGYFGPSNLSWTKEVNFATPFEYRSSKTRNKTTNAIQFMTNELHYSIDLQDKLTKEVFLEWREVYVNNINEKELGSVKLNEDWYDKHPEIETFGAIIIRNESKNIIGGALISKKHNTISCDYRAHEYLHIKDASLATIIEYLIDQYALNVNAKVIKRGTDQNIYGVRLSTGLHNFKAENHFIPYPLDSRLNYYPRYLIFFKEYNDILTYIYNENSTNKIERLLIDKTLVSPKSILESHFNI